MYKLVLTKKLGFKVDMNLLNAALCRDISENLYDSLTEEILSKYIYNLGFKSRFPPNITEYLEYFRNISNLIPKNLVIISEQPICFKNNDNSLFTIITPETQEEYNSFIISIRNIVYKNNQDNINVILPFEGSVINIIFDEFNNLIYGVCESVGKKLFDSITVFRDKHLPRQIVFGGNICSQKFNYTDLDIIRTKKLIEAYDMKIYLHGPLTFNLSDPIKCKAEDMSKYLITARKCGLKGVVFHVGKAVELNPKHALTYMTETIVKCLPFASPSCPFLLETGAGVKSELLKTVQEFKDFIIHIREFAPKELIDNFGICVDTCHVFAQGYDPTYYINEILFENGELSNISSTLKLIHLNDSKTKKGSCKDYHEAIGKGCIGVNSFLEIINIGAIHSIPLIFEAPSDGVEK